MAKLKYTAKKHREPETNNVLKKPTSTKSGKPKGATSSPQRKLAGRSVSRSKATLRQSPRQKLSKKTNPSETKLLQSPRRLQQKKQSTEASGSIDDKDVSAERDRSTLRSKDDGIKIVLDLTQDSSEESEAENTDDNARSPPCPRPPRKVKNLGDTVKPPFVPSTKTECSPPVQSSQVSKYFNSQTDTSDTTKSTGDKVSVHQEVSSKMCLQAQPIKGDVINRDAQVVLTKLPCSLVSLKGYKLDTAATCIDIDEGAACDTLKDADLGSSNGEKENRALKGKIDEVTGSVKLEKDYKGVKRKVSGSGAAVGESPQGACARKVVKKAKLSLNRKGTRKNTKEAVLTLDKSLNETDDFTQAMPKFKTRSQRGRDQKKDSPQKLKSLSPVKGSTENKNVTVSVRRLESFQYKKSEPYAEKLRSASPQKGMTQSSGSKLANVESITVDDEIPSVKTDSVQSESCDRVSRSSLRKNVDDGPALPASVLDDTEKEVKKCGKVSQSAGVCPPGKPPSEPEVVHVQEGERVGKREDKGSTVSLLCQICQKDLSHFNTPRRNQHVNRCIDTHEEELTRLREEQVAVEAARNKVLDCPLCGQALKTHNARKTHLKKCASKYHIATSVLMGQVRQQEQEYQLQLAAGVIPLPVKRAKKKPKRARQVQGGVRAVPQSAEYIGLDEQTQLALALSTSLQEEKQRKDLEDHIPTHILDGDPNVTNAFNVLMTPTKPQLIPPTKRRKKKKVPTATLR